MRQEFRDVSINARRSASAMSQGTLPFAQMGAWQSETPPWHRRRDYFQGLGFLRHRLSQQSVSGSGQERIARGQLVRKIFGRKRNETFPGKKIYVNPSN